MSHSIDAVPGWTNEFDRRGDERSPAPETWSTIAWEILYTLAQRVPVLELSQTCRIWWRSHTTTAIAERQLDVLCSEGWLNRYSMKLCWPSFHQRPTIRWSPGQVKPNMRKLRTAARMVDDCGPVVDAQLYMVSPITANIFGVPFQGNMIDDRLTSLLEWAHVYVQTTIESDPRGRTWNAPDLYPKERRRDKFPIIASVSDAGAVTAVGLLAHSSPGGLHLLHQHCDDHSISYELW